MTRDGPEGLPALPDVTGRGPDAEPALAAAGAVRAWLLVSAGLVHEARVRLTELDAAIGDGDHGINLDRGFGLLAARLGDRDLLDLPAHALLAAAGRLLLGSVGGASGALYGRALMRAGAALGRASGEHAVAQGADDESGFAAERSRADAAVGQPVRLPLVVAAFDAAVASIAELGRSGSGDKTMLDALIPAANELRAGADAGLDPAAALARAAAAADVGAEATRPLVARRGRASYLGERSAGHVDPGAVSAALLVRALADALAAR